MNKNNASPPVCPIAGPGTKQFEAPENLFTKRRSEANFEEFDRIMQRKSGEPPRPEDTLE